jgi:hypothetical protein
VEGVQIGDADGLPVPLGFQQIGVASVLIASNLTPLGSIASTAYNADRRSDPSPKHTHSRCTARKLTPTALAMARPVQWVASPSGSEQVSSKILAKTLAESGARPGLRVLSRSRPSTPCSAYRACQRQTVGRLTPGSSRHFEHRQALGREEDDSCPLHMLERAIAIGDDRQQALAIFGGRKDADGLRHTDRLAHPPAAVNPMTVSEH